MQFYFNFELQSTFMKSEQDYIQDIAAMRVMMERSSRFLSLSGWAGILAGIIALAGAYIAYDYLQFDPNVRYGGEPGWAMDDSLVGIISLGVIMFVLAMGLAMYFSYRRANRMDEKFWNPTSRRLLINLSIPLLAGGILILIVAGKGYVGLMLPLSLIFYGLALYNAGKFTYSEVKNLGLVEIIIGLLSAYFLEYSLIFWAMGFGVAHIIYGIYMHYRYER